MATTAKAPRQLVLLRPRPMVHQQQLRPPQPLQMEADLAALTVHWVATLAAGDLLELGRQVNGPHGGMDRTGTTMDVHHPPGQDGLAGPGITNLHGPAGRPARVLPLLRAPSPAPGHSL